MIARLQDTPISVDQEVAPFLLPSPERALAPPLMQFEHAAVGYGGDPVLRNLDLRIDPDDRIGLLGVNGSGKSTFAKLLAGDLSACAGQVRRSGRMRVGWFHQHQIEAMDPADTPLTIIRRVLPEASEAQRRSRLAQFGMVAAKVETTVADLSGGERARLLLNLVALSRPHLLILDEPTNHLDIDSRRALSEAINDYAGAVVLIAHDRSLMEMVADRLWLVNGGTIRPFDGDMDDYARHVLAQARSPGARSQKKAAPSRASGPPPGVIERKLHDAEAALARQTQAVARLESQLADPRLARDPARLAACEAAHAEGVARLAQAEAAWMALAEAHEAASR
jgi:ATP-binding cassette subfamily F protein 3